MTPVRGGVTDADGRRPTTRLRLRTFLLAGMLVPLAGMMVLAGMAIAERNADRRASHALVDEVDVLKSLIVAVSAVADEESHANVFSLAADFDIEPSVDGVWDVRRADFGQKPFLTDGYHHRLETDRRAVDRYRAPTDAGRARFAELQKLRRRIDAGTASYDDVSPLFQAINADLEGQWRLSLERIRTAVEQRSLDDDLRPRLRTLRETLEAFAHSDSRLRDAVHVLIGGGGTEETRRLQDSTSRFVAATERMTPPVDSRAAAAWAAFRDDPGAQATESTFNRAIEIGLGLQPPVGEPDLDALAVSLGDASRWSHLLAEAVRAASDDLADGAARQAAADVRTMTLHLAGVGAIAALSILLALTIASKVTGPIAELERAARRIEHGDFDMKALRPAGPREVTATVTAFNDMAGTLSAVEARAVALAEDPEGPVHETPLPGRTGKAMQSALDRLRESIREDERLRQDLAELAARDGLTGLLNRRTALDAAGRELANARRSHRPLVALFIDLDGLKPLNDTYGHAVGDAAICATADALAANAREGDIVSRFGGDEFVVIGPGPAPGDDDIAGFAERLLRAVGAQSVDLGDGSREALRCSIGVACTGGDIDTVDGLVAAADAALYRAKSAGRSRVAFHPPMITQPSASATP